MLWIASVNQNCHDVRRDIVLRDFVDKFGKIFYSIIRR